MRWRVYRLLNNVHPLILSIVASQALILCVWITAVGMAWVTGTSFTAWFLAALTLVAIALATLVLRDTGGMSR